MHMHGTCGTRTPKRTSLGWPQQPVERLATAAAAASARLATLALEPQPLVAVAASVDPPVRGRSGW